MKRRILVLGVILGLLFSCSNRTDKGNYQTEEFDLNLLHRGIGWMLYAVRICSDDFNGEEIRPVSLDLRISFPECVNSAVAVVPDKKIKDHVSIISIFEGKVKGRKLLDVTATFSPQTPFSKWEMGIIQIEIASTQDIEEEWRKQLSSRSRIVYQKKLTSSQAR